MPTVKNKHRSESENWLTPTDKRILKYAAYTGGTLLIGGTVFFTAKHFYKRRKSARAETQSLSEGTPENFAKRIKMAFDNDGFWGTDVEALRKVFLDIPSQEMVKKVAESYEALTGKSKGEFYKDLEDELTTSEYSEIQSIIKGKPVHTGDKKVFDWNVAYSISHRIKAAFDYTVLGMPSTDKGALKIALNQIPSLYAFAMVKVVFRKEYGTELESELDSELDVFDFSWREIVYNKPRK